MLSAFEPDEGLSIIEDGDITLYDGMPMPTLIRTLPSLQGGELSDSPNEEFSFNFLKKVLGGSSISHGWYVVSAKKGRRAEAPLFPNLK